MSSFYLPLLFQSEMVSLTCLMKGVMHCRCAYNVVQSSGGCVPMRDAGVAYIYIGLRMKCVTLSVVQMLLQLTDYTSHS